MGIIYISPSILIDQKRMGTTLRSTVGTATEINAYLKLLFSRCGSKFIGPSFLFGFNHPQGMCSKCRGIGNQIKIDITKLVDLEKSIKNGAINHPDYKVGGWNWKELTRIGLFNVNKKLNDFSEKELDDLLYAKSIPIKKKPGEEIYRHNLE